MGPSARVLRPAFHGYYDGHKDTYLSTDVSSKAEARSMHVNYSASLGTVKGLPEIYLVQGRAAAGQEFPKQVVKVPGARGAFSGTLTKHGSGAKLTFKLTFSHLSAPAFAAHIHLGKPGVAGNVIVPLCAPCKSGAHGTKTVSGAIAGAIEAGKTYVNVHTVKNPAGEIRGQVKATA